MSQETINNALQKTLFSPLTHDELWPQFLEAISYELYNMREKYASIKNSWNINENDKDNLIRIAQSFGYNPNLVLNNTIEMAIKEIESIPYRIRKKTTYEGYKIILNQNALLGEAFNYYYNGYKLIKAINYNETLKELENSDHYSPFTKIIPIKNFSTILNSDYMMLDYLKPDGTIDYEEPSHIRIWSLDQIIIPWKLDNTYIKTPTNHLGLEYYPIHSWCSYVTSLGVGEKETNIYEMNIFIEDYLEKSISIHLGDEELPITINDVDGVEYFTNDDEILDSSDSFYNPKEKKIRLHFNEIPIDREITFGYNINLLMTPDYFYHLEYGSEYNRSCSIIPHAGIFLTAEIASSHGSDFYYPNEEHYTVPDLKMKALTASAMNRYTIVSQPSWLDYAKDAQGQPSGFENYKLDSSIKWFLDTSSEQSVPLKDKFKYIACGNKALNMVNEEYSQIFNHTSMIFYYNLNTDDDSSIINDISSNNLTCEVTGDTIKIDGIIDKSLNFNGSTYAVSASSLSMEPTIDYTFGLWFKANEENESNIGTIFDSFINISYDYENEKLIIDETNEFDCPKNTDIFLTLIFHKNSNDVSVYMNSQSLGTITYTMILTSKPIYIGTNPAHDLNFYGIIDNLWLLTKIMTESEINYIYDDKISAISHMGNRIAYYELYEDEISEKSNNVMIQSYVKSMDVTNENIKIEDDGSENYSSQSKFYPIKPSYFTMKYKNLLAETVVLKGNEKGELYKYDPITQSVGEQVTGSINYAMGQWSLAKNTIKSISQSKIDSPTETQYPTAYHVIDELESTDKWYTTYDPIHDTFTGEFTADEIVTDGATSYSSLFIYNDENDIAPYTKIYSSDNESYYIKKDNSDKPLSAYVINNDSNETHLFSIDGGKALFHNLTDLTNNANQLRSYVDLGELSNTTLYSMNGGDTMYLNVACTADKQVHKYYKISDPKTYGYTINGDITVYSNLSFTSILDNNLDNWESQDFSPMEIISRITQVNLELVTIQSRDIYTDIYSIDYIQEMNVYVDNLLHPNKVPNSIMFSYWIENDDEVLVKYTATVDEGGNVSGTNILTGNFSYETNLLYVLFREKVKSDVVISYEYYNTLDININEPLTMNYKIEKPIDITEIGLEDENHELMAYMTFPSIRFNDIYNNISAMFSINTNN